MAAAAVGKKGQPVLDVLESTAQVMFRVTGYVMHFAPIGVFAAIAATLGGNGLSILFTLGKLVFLMYFGLALFVLIVVGADVVVVGDGLLLLIDLLGNLVLGGRGGGARLLGVGRCRRRGFCVGHGW